MDKKLNQMFEDYDEVCNQAIEKARDIGDYLVSKLKPVIPDLCYSVSWEEEGVNMICFYSDRYSFPDKKNSKYYHFSDIISDIIPLALYHVSDPFGIHLNKEKVEKIKKILEED